MTGAQKMSDTAKWSVPGLQCAPAGEVEWWVFVALGGTMLGEGMNVQVPGRLHDDWLTGNG